MKRIKRKQIREEIVPQRINKQGYNVVDLEDEYGNVIQRGVRVDVMVFEAFVRKLRSDEEVIHLDGNKQNNCVENLKAVRK